MAERLKKKPPTPGVFYITHRDNLPSIIKHGVLSHNMAEEHLPDREVIYDHRIVSRRGDKQTPDGNTLWDFANFYFQPRNAMLYRVSYCEERPVIVLHLNNTLCARAKYVSVGNAASHASQIVDVKSGLAQIQGAEMQEILHSPLWTGDAGEISRLMMSELLVPTKVPANYIDTIYVPDKKTVLEVKEQAGGIHVVPEPRLFFKSDWHRKLRGANITLIRGDMFFSAMQTLTISVNTVGIMGKGLASRVRYNFPHLYVRYEDQCKAKKMTTKTPYLCKQPYSFDELADDPGTLAHNPNGMRRFLFFATKMHWRYPSKLEYLQDGFQWLKKNAAENGITSLAMPALGCGLGNLRWEQVGPLMCQNLRELNIPCEIYLPLETDRDIPDDQLSDEFLLGGNG